jgi:hypothetical protein
MNNDSGNGRGYKKLLEELKQNTEQFHNSVSEIAQTEVAASPPFDKQLQQQQRYLYLNGLLRHDTSGS